MSNSEITYEDIKRAAENARVLRANDSPEVYVMTTEVYGMLKRDIAGNVRAEVAALPVLRNMGSDQRSRIMVA